MFFTRQFWRFVELFGAFRILMICPIDTYLGNIPEGKTCFSLGKPCWDQAFSSENGCFDPQKGMKTKNWLKTALFVHNFSTK